MRAIRCPILAAIFLLATFAGRAASTIDTVNRYAYGANIGWLDALADTSNGAVIGEYVCSGYIYSANVGWINLGSGLPTNGVHYQNTSANDFGVNHDGSGNLRGFAYGANIGWVDFEDQGAPTIDLKTGKFSGYVYSANCGWISLSNISAFVQTDSIAPGADTDHNGLPDAWEILNFGHTGVNPSADPDRDGVSNAQEYQAGTDPNDASSTLRILGIATAPAGSDVTLNWTSVTNRCYQVQETLELNAASWFDSGLGTIAADGPVSTTRTIIETNAPSRFFRVTAFRPLGP